MCPVMPLAKVQEPIAAVIGLASELQKIECGPCHFQCLKTKWKMKLKKIVLDNFNLCVLHTLVLNWNITDKRFQQSKVIYKKFYSDAKYTSCVHTLQKIT